MTRGLRYFALILLCGQAGMTPAFPATFTVTQIGDTGPGSLRQAILDANARAGTDRVEFNLPGPGPYSIRPLTQLPFITDPIVIDATSQQGYAGQPLVELNGTDAGVSSVGLYVNSGNTTVRGLAINRFRGFAAIFVNTRGGSRFEANFIGTDFTGTANLGNAQNGILIVNSTNNIIGGITAAERNLISGNGFSGVQLALSGSANNVVQGNYIGTDITGTVKLGNAQAGILVSSAPFNVIGGDLAGAGNLVSGNNLSGIEIAGQGATGNRVAGNRIGIDAASTKPIGNGQAGVFISQSSNNLVGGTNDLARNYIAGNEFNGIEISGAGAIGNRILNNWVGTGTKGTENLGNSFHGIFVNQGASGTVIGGSEPAFGNRVVFSGGDGVFLEQTLNNSVRGNAIAFNRALGIDIAPDGPTPNDPNDADSGANDLQNYPAITCVTELSGRWLVQGTLNSTPNAVFALDFFGCAECDPTRFGEGDQFLGSVLVTNTAAGTQAFSATLVAPSDLHFLTATATAMASGNTSEFSLCIPVAAQCAPALSLTRTSTAGELMLTWPASFGTFLLEKSDLIAGGTWTSAGGSPVEVNGQFQVRISAGPGTLFYRLRRG